MMKGFKNRVLAILMAACMMLSLLPVSALAEEDGFDLTIDVNGTGVTWYAADKEGTEIGDEGFAVPSTEIELDTDGEVPTISVTTAVYVKANPGYAITELEEFDLDINGDDDKDEDLPSTLDIEITDEGLEYCDLMVTLKFDGYAVEGKSASIALTIDAEPAYDLTIDVDGTGVIWYAADKEGTEIGDEGFAVPSTEIEVDTDGEVPTISVTTTVYVKAAPGYAITELEEFDLDINGDDDKDEDLPTTLDIEVTDEGLEYCDLMVTLKFDGYAVKGTSTSIALTIDAEPTYLTIMAGDTKLDIGEFSTESYADAEAIVHGVAYDAEGTTVAVSASVADSKDGVIIEEVTEGDPAFDEEPHNGGTVYVDVTPENTVENPVYVAVKYVPDKTGTVEAKPYDEFFKIALYMTPETTGSFTDVSSGDYFYDAVAWAVEQGVAKGTGDGTTFSPSDNCTRAQFATFLWRAAGSPEPTGTEATFSDVSETTHSYYYDAILWAAEEGVTKGTGDGTTFSPDAAVTRAQSVTFMYRYAQKAGIAAETGTPNFDDVSSGGALAPYYDAIGWAVANGITNGTGDGTNFSPMADCDRGMMITFLYRLFKDASV